MITNEMITANSKAKSITILAKKPGNRFEQTFVLDRFNPETDMGMLDALVKAWNGDKACGVIIHD